jgi:hypothetical protein
VKNILLLFMHAGVVMPEATYAVMEIKPKCERNKRAGVGTAAMDCALGAVSRRMKESISV